MTVLHVDVHKTKKKKKKKKKAAPGTVIKSLKKIQKTTSSNLHNKKKATTTTLLNGTEPPYQWLPYGSEVGRMNNNCYAYARLHYRKQGNQKLQPGELAGGNLGLGSELQSCQELETKILKDAPRHTYKLSSFRQKCRPGFWKVALVLDKGVDYHFYMQNNHVLYRAKEGDTSQKIARRLGIPLHKIKTRSSSSSSSLREGETVLIRNAGLWSHKRGLLTGPLLVDAKGKPIYNPTTASRDYGDLNYNITCSPFCFKALVGTPYDASSWYYKTDKKKKKKNNARTGARKTVHTTSR
jgi:hypothetical protein